MPRRPGIILRAAFRLPVLAYRCHLGWLFGHRFLLLRHTGRRTGARYETVLEVLEYRVASGEAFVMSGFGATADWYRNVQTSGPTEITMGTRTYPVSHRTLGGDEATLVLAAYEHRNRWIRPIVRKVLSSLARIAYDGSDVSRRSLVQRLPIVAFTARRE